MSLVVCTGDQRYAERAAARLKSFEARDSVKGIVLPNAVETTGRENRLKSRGTSKALIGTQISVDNSKLQVSKGGTVSPLIYARTTIHICTANRNSQQGTDTSPNVVEESQKTAAVREVVNSRMGPLHARAHRGR
eukprot:SAG31_NODE_1195_length_9445_cov_21.712711_6_plen_135_part_00